MGTVITFYSYKGGVGRTFALANIAALLAMNGKKILCIDWDLEAPGLEYYFTEYFKSKPTKGVVELITALKENPEEDWRNYFIRVEWNKPFSGSFDFITAGDQNETYTKRMQDFNWENLYRENKIGEKLERLREEWTKEYDFILIDSRAGITDIGGICTIQMPDVLLTFATANNQSINGTKSTIEKILTARKEMPYPRAFLNCVPVLTRVDSAESDLQLHWEEYFIEATEDIYGEWIENGAMAKNLLKRVVIPYFPKYSYGEELSVLNDKRATLSINDYFENLAALILHGLAETNDFINDRDRYISNALKLTKQTQSAQIREIPPLNLETEVDYLDLILEGKEGYVSASNQTEYFVKLELSISREISKATEELHKVINSPSGNEIILSKQIFDKLANTLDIEFYNLDQKIGYLGRSISSTVENYKKGFSLIFHSPELLTEQLLQEKYFIITSLPVLINSLENINTEYTALRELLTSVPQASKQFKLVQSNTIKDISSLLEVAAWSIERTQELIDFLNQNKYVMT